MSIQAAAAGLPLAVADRAAIAVRLILAGNKRIGKWTEGRVRRGILLAIPAGLPAPTILVAALQSTPVKAVGCVELSVPIAIGMYWTEPLGFLQDDQGSAETVKAEIIRELLANYFLKVPIFGENRLVKRLEEFRPLGEPQYAEGKTSVAILETIVADYRCTLNPRTWEVQEGH